MLHALTSLMLVFSAYVLARSPVDLPQFTPDVNGNINLVCQLTTGLGRAEGESIVLLGLNRAAGTVVIREANRQYKPVPMQITAQDLTFSIPTRQAPLAYKVNWEDMTFTRDVMFGSSVFSQGGVCSENTARQPAADLAPGSVQSPSLPPAVASMPSAPGRTLVSEWGAHNPNLRGTLERVQSPDGPSADDMVLTFSTNNRQQKFELVCLQRPRRQVVLRYTLDPSSQWSMHKTHPDFSNELSVRGVGSERRELLSDARLWTFTATGATLADPAQITAFAVSFATSEGVDIEFLKYRTGPPLVSQNGTVYGATQFPERSIFVKTSPGAVAPAVRSVMELCGYSTSGL